MILVKIQGNFMEWWNYICVYIYIYSGPEPFTQSNPSSSIAFPLKKLSLEWFPGNKNCLFTQEYWVQLSSPSIDSTCVASWCLLLCNLSRDASKCRADSWVKGNYVFWHQKLWFHNTNISQIRKNMSSCSLLIQLCMIFDSEVLWAAKQLYMYDIVWSMIDI